MRLKSKNRRGELNREWGFETITLSPFYFNALRLEYALRAISGIGGKVLELGCGAGAFVRAIKHYRPDLEFTGTDIDKFLVAQAKKMDKKNTYKVANAQKLTFNKESFNAVIAFDVIEHLKSPKSAFGEAFRVLKKRGVFHASIPLEADPFTIPGLFIKLGFRPKEIYAGHIQSFNSKDIINMLDEAGFKEISCVFSGHIMYQLMDFAYFSGLSIFAKKPSRTVEGYIENLKKGKTRNLLNTIISFFSFLSWSESRFLPFIPGQIGHFTAIKP